ncbi:2-hydroxy-3-oxopropionate reductase [Nitrosomonas europaea]|uniref:Probable oxidoreductase n=2 Tax=Nitrosomonas europaea TaxID=915 RepID=Q82WJ8_NITEU|nr:MAG: oxidoreductase [Nitrosomonas europaea]CAD84587.1 probable oxidoreductase [Nitrosomonas europaea ATCC 19718]HBF24389.1 2-hydroxy-3-oxopropionate reductase [Nitrosomonas sp.]SDW06432.1 2-hydroxy-3-oxopropionate reductase [Nitrosomonas europaea]SES69942.1 2-hydroxy-3-oxopropionate reductase [Nitrosomonas europaea]
MTTIGFIGLGIMGKPMAGHLIRGGYPVYLNSRSGIPAELTVPGGLACPTPRAVAEQADIIILMLPDTPDVEKVLFAENGVAQGLSANPPRSKIIIDMSTISPIRTRDFVTRIRQLGHEYADAPVSGGDIGAQNATLTIMVGATEAVFAEIEPILALMGKTVTRIGDPGTGQVCKAANQIIAALTLEAVAEALVLASRAGADPNKVRQALLGGFAASRILEVHGERMIKHAFTPGFRVDLHRKDLGIALDCATELGVSLPGTALVQSLYNASIAQGDAQQDSSAIVRILEQLAGHTLDTSTESAHEH